jgi:hypothetical protein
VDALVGVVAHVAGHHPAPVDVLGFHGLHRAPAGRPPLERAPRPHARAVWCSCGLTVRRERRMEDSRVAVAGSGSSGVPRTGLAFLCRFVGCVSRYGIDLPLARGRFLSTVGRWIVLCNNGEGLPVTHFLTIGPHVLLHGAVLLQLHSLQRLGSVLEHVGTFECTLIQDLIPFG